MADKTLEGMEVEIEEMEEGQTVPGDEETTMTTETPAARGTIWDNNMVEKFVCDEDSEKKWRCLWCKNESIKWNGRKTTSWKSTILFTRRDCWRSMVEWCGMIQTTMKC